MDNRDEVKAFLSSRRAKIGPEQAGLAHYSRNRRVPGLRRSEVADLAGVSVEYYAQLERGNLAGVSESVLDALGRALHLTEAEREHLSDLARAAGPNDSSTGCASRSALRALLQTEPKNRSDDTPQVRKFKRVSKFPGVPCQLPPPPTPLKSHS